MIQIVILTSIWGFTSVKDIVEVLLIPILVIVLAQRIAHRWQNQQRDSQTKATLVEEISELVMTTVMTVYLFSTTGDAKNANGNNDQSRAELDRIYKQWRIKTCVIGSKLHAYFPKAVNGKLIHLRWNAFADRLCSYFEYFCLQENNQNISKLEVEKEKLFSEKAEIIASILTSKITGFGYKYK